MFKYFSLEIQIEKIWVLKLLEEYQSFLINYHKEQKAVRKHLMNAAPVFIDMERILPHELTFQWLESCYQNHKTTLAKRSLRGFLLEKKIIKEPSEEEYYRNVCENYLKDCPSGFTKCITWYYDEKFSLQKRQISNNARNPIKSRTIEGDVCFLSRMVKWIVENHPALKSWLDITEELVNQFLLSLKPSNRECMRKDLYQFFKFALRKRCIFTIPMTDYTTREVARVNYTLSFEEQAVLARKIQDEGISYPYEALLTSLAFFHAMQPRYIGNILLLDIDIDNKVIHMMGVPDVYLTPIEMVLLKEYLSLRADFPNCEGKKFLFIPWKRGNSYQDKPILKSFITRLVKSFSGFNSQTLRITCLQSMANLYGPQFLREAYGVSQTHASRFGKYEDYLIEEALDEFMGKPE